MDDEVFTCICGNELWSIHEGFIRCSKCKKEFELKYLGGGGFSEIPSPEYFNSIQRNK